MSTPLKVTRIGHACQLIQIGGTRVLTDPWFTQTATYYHGEPVTSRRQRSTSTPSTGAPTVEGSIRAATRIGVNAHRHRDEPVLNP